MFDRSLMERFLSCRSSLIDFQTSWMIVVVDVVGSRLCGKRLERGREVLSRGSAT